MAELKAESDQPSSSRRRIIALISAKKVPGLGSPWIRVPPMLIAVKAAASSWGDMSMIEVYSPRRCLDSGSVM